MAVEIIGAPTDLNRSFVLWDNILARSSYTTNPIPPSATPFLNCLDPMTWSYWRQGQPNANTITFDFGDMQEIDTMGFAAHTLGSTGAQVSLQSSVDGVTFTNIVSFRSFANDDTTVWVFPKVSVRYVRITLRFGPANVGVIFLGKRYIFPHTPVDSYTPLSHSIQYTKMFNDSLTGHFLGNRVMAKGAETEVDFGFVPRWFVKTDAFRVFANHYGRGGTFFFSSYPIGEPLDVGYCRPSTDDGIVAVEYVNGDKLANLSFGVRSYVG